MPVGRPVGRARVMVLDEKLDPVPVGTAGEIYIGGCGVARGYLGRPALTAERFVPDPGGVPGGRMYRTGDLGRWLAGGDLEVAGRMDRQLKVRGFRVEPGEIESVLAGHPDIDQVSVVASTRSSGDTRLVAYYTPSRRGRRAAPRTAGRPQASAATCSTDCPATWSRRRSSLATTCRRRQRAEEDRNRKRTRSGTGSRWTRSCRVKSRPEQGERPTPTQEGLSALWARLLHREHVSGDDDFFALGGNSLLAAEMLARTRASFGISADSVRPLTRCLLRDPTLRGFAAAVEDARAGRLSADGDQPEIDFASEARLGLRIRRDGAPSRPRPDWRSPREILLTGATGFLGAHLLSELLATTNARVWCLVRARDEGDALRRIADAAARYELPAPADGRVDAAAR